MDFPFFVHNAPFRKLLIYRMRVSIISVKVASQNSDEVIKAAHVVMID